MTEWIKRWRWGEGEEGFAAPVEEGLPLVDGVGGAVEHLAEAAFDDGEARGDSCGVVAAPGGGAEEGGRRACQRGGWWPCRWI